MYHGCSLFTDPLKVAMESSSEGQYPLSVPSGSRGLPVVGVSIALCGEDSGQI